MREDGGRTVNEQTERLPGTDRVKARADFLRLQKAGRRVHTPHFVVLLGSSEGEHARVGATVTKKVGGAVERNRVKRLVREAFRRNRALFPADQDVVFVARAGAPELGYEDVVHEIESVAGAMRAVAERNRRDSRHGERR